MTGWDVVRTVPSMDITIRHTAIAAPSDVYSVLADVATHRRWAGEQQLRPFRLLELAGARAPL